MIDKLYHRANQRSSFRPTVHLVVEIQRFVYDCATHPIIEKLCTHMAFLHTTRDPESIKWTYGEPFEMNVKNKQELNFIVDNDSRLFFNAQKAKNGEQTYSS